MFRAHPFLFLLLIAGIILFGIEVTVGIENVLGRVVRQRPFLKTVLSEGGKIGLAGTVIVFMGWWIKNHYTRLIVTRTHARKRTGIISNQSSQLRHADIKNMQVDQGPVQYVFGTGTLELSSAGQAAEEIIITDIPNPEQITRALSRQRRELVG